MKTFLTLVSIGAITLGSTLPSQAGAQTLQDAIKLTNKEQFERATAAFKQLIIASPQNGEVWFYMGENYWESEHPDSAEYCYHKGLEGNPHFALNTVGIGKTLWVKGKKPEAQAQFEGAVASACDKANKNSKPAQAKVYREVAEALVQGVDKDFAKAQEFIEIGRASCRERV